MKKRLRIINHPLVVYWIVALLTFQCTTDRQRSINKYFNIRQLVQDQISVLIATNGQLKKTITIDDHTETVVLSALDSIQWEKEFKIFREHDINKPFLRDAYVIERGGKGNDSTEIYHLAEGSTSGILGMEITYDPEGNITSWNSRFREENLLYSNFREISMKFNQRNQLGSYFIDGYHKLMFKDTVHYSILVEVIY